MNLYLFIVANAFREKYAPVFARVSVTTPEFILSLKAFDLFFFVVKNLNQLFVKFSKNSKSNILFSTYFSKPLKIIGIVHILHF